MERGYLWENLEHEVEVAFHQPHPLDPDSLATMFFTLDDTSELFGGIKSKGGAGEVAFNAEQREANRAARNKPPRVLKGKENWRSVTESVRALRARRKAGGLCIDCGFLMDAKSKNFCPFHREKDRLRAAEKLKRRKEQMELPEDRDGVRVRFNILVRDDVGDQREVKGYVTMNFMPDGKSLREIFLTVGKAGSSEAMYDEWAKQASNRLQEGATVEQVFYTHVGTQFGDRGFLKKPIGEIKQCTSVLDLVSRIIIARFGEVAA